jgi:hypothetical protein
MFRVCIHINFLCGKPGFDQKGQFNQYFKKGSTILETRNHEQTQHGLLLSLGFKIKVQLKRV